MKMSQSKRTRSRNYCFTTFNMNLDIENIYNKNDCIKYICAGREKCPTTGKEHLQGWIQFKIQKSIKTVKKTCEDGTMHLEAMKGNEFENDRYCKKEGNFKFFGKHTGGQGHRSDLDEVCDKIIKGVPMSNIAKEHPRLVVQYGRGLKHLSQCLEKDNRKTFRKLEVTLITGPTGTGKTRYAMEQEPYKIQGSDLKWWDGYEGEDTILIDEYNNDTGITTLLKLLDGYQLRLDTKGSFTYANWHKVYITTNLELHEIHDKAKPAHRDALFRRITKTINLWDNPDELSQGT